MGGGWSATESAGGAPQIHVAAHHTGVRREHVAILGAGVTDCQWTPIGISLRGMLRTREGGPPRHGGDQPRRTRATASHQERPPCPRPVAVLVAPARPGAGRPQRHRPGRGRQRRSVEPEDSGGANGWPWSAVAVVCRAGRLHPTGQLRVCTFSAPTPRTRRPWLSPARGARSAVPDRSRPNQAAHRPRGGRDREPGGRGRRRGRRPGGHRGRAGGLLPGQPSNSGIR